MKKTIFRIVVLAFMLASIWSLTSCGLFESDCPINGSTPESTSGKSDPSTDNPYSHQHTLGAWEGDAHRHWNACLDCGERFNIEDHDAAPPEITASTYTDMGSLGTQFCGICGGVIHEAEMLPALNTSHGHYAYEALASMASGVSMQQFYAELFAACETFHESTSVNATEYRGYLVACAVSFAEHGITADQAYKVLRALQADCPLFYWISNTSATDDKTLYVCADDEYALASARSSYNRSIYEKFAGFARPHGGMYDQLLGLHDHILNSMEYAYKSDGVTPMDDAASHNIIGFFEHGYGVCEAYTEVFSLYLNYWGIENIRVSGTADGTAHAWNLVRLDDGKWYWFDLTWDDSTELGDGNIYGYFCCIDSSFGGERTVDNAIYSLPERSETAYVINMSV